MMRFANSDSNLLPASETSLAYLASLPAPNFFTKRMTSCSTLSSLSWVVPCRPQSSITTTCASVDTRMNCTANSRGCLERADTSGEPLRGFDVQMIRGLPLKSTSFTGSTEVRVGIRRFSFEKMPITLITRMKASSAKSWPCRLSLFVARPLFSASRASRATDSEPHVFSTLGSLTSSASDRAPSATAASVCDIVEFGFFPPSAPSPPLPPRFSPASFLSSPASSFAPFLPASPSAPVIESRAGQAARQVPPAACQCSAEGHARRG
mmetsp:Transcript_98912/g.258411  ORF Transcript_98912/g.258411 Transcript_98912/m.258411 type:complete len:266 (-) Transcript_98912:34-831(-)